MNRCCLGLILLVSTNLIRRLANDAMDYCCSLWKTSTSDTDSGKETICKLLVL